MAYRHIMAGVDVTEEATQVLAAARALATEHGARLSVCTVVKPLTQVYGGLDMLAYTQATVNFEQEAANQARAQVEQLAAAYGVAPADAVDAAASVREKAVEVAVGEQASRRYFVTAERFDAERARALGFVHEVVPATLLDARVAEIVAALIANGPAAVKACKQLVKDVAGRPLDAALREDTARRIADIRASAEGREGTQSFLDKREPAWRRS